MAYVSSGKEEELFLKNFDPSKYKNPGVAADTALFALDGDSLNILLIKRGEFPYKGKWALPGGFVNIDEDIKAAASRELFEETGIPGLYSEQAFVWGAPERDPRQRVITVSYISLVDFSEVYVKAGDDASEAGWFELKDYRNYDREGFTYIEYTLSGPETLFPAVKFPYGRVQQIMPVNSGGLAFDHAESVAYSFEYLKQRVKYGGFLDFALSDRKLREKARKIILGF
jgi:8-oxo-dGTP diphosphatase